LREELKEEVNHSLVINGIESFQTDSNSHLANTSDHSEFHLEGVHVSKFISRLEPLVVHSKWVDTVGLD
jgi:hypothetical protein